MAHFANSSEPKRSWARRVLIGVNILLVVAIVIGAGAVGYALFLNGKIDRINLGLGGRSPGKPMNILIVGSDSRDDMSLADRKKFGGPVGHHSDSIMLMHLDPKTKGITLVSFPRDLYVPIANTGRRNKINSAYNDGKTQKEGAKNLIDTIEQNYNVRIDHFMAVDFVGFRSIVDAIGGVNVHFDSPARDLKSGFSVRQLDSNGCVRLHGEIALAYSRSRYYQVYRYGRYQSDGRSDWGRIERQQDFLRRVAARAVHQANGSAITAERLVRKTVKYLTVDDGLDLKTLVNLAKTYKSVDPQTINQLGAVPGKDSSVGKMSVVIPDFDAASKMLEPFRAGSGESQQGTNATTTTSVAAIARSEIKVRVLNGTGVKKQAAAAALALKAAGFTTMGSASADSSTYATTIIRYNVGQEQKARILQSALGGASLIQQATVTGADVEVVTGATYTGVTATANSSTTVSTGSSTTKVSTGGSSSTTSTTRGIGAPSLQQCPP